MSSDWPDLPGVTALDGRPLLPRVPAQVVRALVLAVDGARGGVRQPDLVHAIVRETRMEPARAEGFVGWLPVSHVARWTAEGALTLDPQTDLMDLGLRFAAWAATQPIAPELTDQVRAYVRAVAELAADAARGRPQHSIPPPSADHPFTAAELELASAPAPAPLLDPSVSRRARKLVAALEAAFLERRTQVRMAMLAVIAGQHVLLLGPPGTAKSALARALCECFVDARYFEYLLSRFTHPDELFGPVSIPGLKEEDYRRLTLGFLPQAHIAFLDEIFKANSAILNSLLTIVNERVFHHGRHRDAVPLIGLVGASNELPDPEGGLEALYDRFLVRLPVPPLGTPEAFLEVAGGRAASPVIPPDARLNLDELAAIRAAAQRVTLAPLVEGTLVALWRAAQQGEWGVSDRRWRQAVGLLKVAAATADRREVLPVDLLLLEHIIAQTPDRAAEVREAILERLATRAVPTHDLRAQWYLLEHDRVAPTSSTRNASPRFGGNLQVKLVRRQEHLNRFVAHHRRAVEALAADRERIETEAVTHPWLSTLPPQMVAEHLSAARELAKILQVAERYRATLQNVQTAAAALVRSLPETSKRKYGFSSVCILRIPDADVSVGLTLAGEREDVPTGEAPANAATSVSEVPVVTVTAHDWVTAVEGALEVPALLRNVPVYATRQATTALTSAIRSLGGSAVPRPPPLPVA